MEHLSTLPHLNELENKTIISSDEHNKIIEEKKQVRNAFYKYLTEQIQKALDETTNFHEPTIIDIDTDFVLYTHLNNTNTTIYSVLSGDFGCYYSFSEAYCSKDCSPSEANSETFYCNIYGLKCKGITLFEEYQKDLLDLKGYSIEQIIKMTGLTQKNLFVLTAKPLENKKIKEYDNFY